MLTCQSELFYKFVKYHTYENLHTYDFVPFFFYWVYIQRNGLLSKFNQTKHRHPELCALKVVENIYGENLVQVLLEYLIIS